MKLQAPFLIPVCGVVAGIMTANAGIPIIACLGLLIIAAGIFIYLSKVANNPIKSFKLNKLHHIWIFMIFMVAGMLTASLNAPARIDDVRNYTAVKGNILSIRHSTSGDIAVVDVKELVDRNGKAIEPENMPILLRSDAMVEEPGDGIVFAAEISEIKDSENYFSTGYTNSLNRKGIYYEARCDGANIKKYSEKWSMGATSAKIRQKIEIFIEYSPLSVETKNFLITILLGDRAYLDKETRDVFADAGISHILALSGMHIAIIGGILLWLLFPLNFYGHYKIRLIITIALLLAYAYLTGWQPSTVRAVLMLAFTTAGILIERKNTAWNSLLSALFIILIINPYALYDVGLQLSFLCVASIIIFVSRLNPYNRHDHPFRYNTANAILTILTVTGCTWCVTAYYFGSVPVMFLPINLLIIPLLPIYLALAILYLILLAFGIEIGILADSLNYGYELMKEFIAFLTNGGETALRFNPSMLTVFFWLGFISIVALWLYSSRGRWLKYGSGILLVCFVCTAVFTINAEAQDGFIVQKGIGNVAILAKERGCENLRKHPVQTIGIMEIIGHRVVIVDASPTADDMCMETPLDCDELVIASGYKGSLEDIGTRFRSKKIIIHPSVRKKREAALIQEAAKLGLSCHSIRNDGAYRVMADQNR